MRTSMENKFKTGDFVYSRHATDKKLVVKRHIDRIYYCQHADDKSATPRENVYFERELISESERNNNN